MKSKKKSFSPALTATAAANPPPPTREQIQALAHALWMDRGCPTGSDVEIWLEAEQQLRDGSERLHDSDRVDLETSEAARVDRELERVVHPPEPRSPTAL